MTFDTFEFTAMLSWVWRVQLATLDLLWIDRSLEKILEKDSYFKSLKSVFIQELFYWLFNRKNPTLHWNGDSHLQNIEIFNSFQIKYANRVHLSGYQQQQKCTYR